jgi:hypothetical protein
MLRRALACLLLAACLPAACSAPQRAPESAAASPADFRAQLAGMPGRIDRTFASLKAARSGADPSASFKSFSDDLAAMAYDSGTISSAATRALREGPGFLDTLDRSGDPARQAEINDRLQTARREYRDMVGALTDVQAALQNNLTPQAFSAVQPLVQDAQIQAIDARNTLKDLIALAGER